MTQYARPISDIENPGGWATEPLWEKLAEEPFDDDSYITSPKSASGASFTQGLSPLIDPEVHTDHIIRIRAKTGVSGTFKYELMQGPVVIKDSGDVVLGTATIEYNILLSEGEAESISDYGALWLRVTAISTQKNQRQNVSWIRVDVPDAVANEFIYNGDIPLTILPDAPKAKLSKSYIGDIPLSVLPGYSSILERAYRGDISLAMTPDFPKAIMEKSYSGDISILLIPNSVYELSSINEYIYNGDIGLSILPSYSSMMEKAYAGDVQISLIPEGQLILERLYRGMVALSILPDFPKAALEKAYGGDVGLAMTVNSQYLLETLKEFIYSGNIPLSVLPGHSLVLDRIYGGDIGLTVIPCSGYELKALIEVVKTVFLKSKLTERLVELKSTIKPSIVLNSEIRPEGEK